MSCCQRHLSYQETGSVETESCCHCGGSFYKLEMEEMLSSAVESIKAYGLELKNIIRVPGSYEKPLAAKRLLLRNDIDGLVVLGIIERGETSHGRVMGQTVSDVLVRLQLEFMNPIGIGIIGPDVQPSQITSRLQLHAIAAVAALNMMLGQEEGWPEK